LVAAAEESRDLEVPASERAVGGTLHECGIEPQHRLELLLHRLAVLQPLPEAVRFGERSHVRRQPEMSFGAIRLRRDRLASRVDALLEKAAALDVRRVP